MLMLLMPWGGGGSQVKIDYVILEHICWKIPTNNLIYIQLNSYSDYSSRWLWWPKKLYYINGSVNIRYHGKTMTYSNDLWLWLTFYDICRGGTVARKCKFDFILKLAICLSITLGYRNCPSVTAHVPGLSQQCWGHQPNTQTIKLHCWDL